MNPTGGQAGFKILSPHLQRQPSREQAGDGGCNNDVGRNPAGPSRFPRENVGCRGLLGSDRRSLDTTRDSAHDPVGGGGMPVENVMPVSRDRSYVCTVGRFIYFGMLT